jgi:hypothetical protein
MGKRVTNASMLGAAIDACVYFGNSADVAMRLNPDPAIYQGTPYGAEIAAPDDYGVGTLAGKLGQATPAAGLCQVPGIREFAASQQPGPCGETHGL